MPARIARHPIHPMLVVFPIGLWVFSLVADLIFLFGPGNPFWRDVSFYTMIGGLIGAVAAAIPGLIDYFSIYDRAAKSAGTTHLTLNVAVVALYGINLWMRLGYAEIAGWPFALSVIAVVLLGLAGWYGGELIFTHGVGVAATKMRPRVEPETPLAARSNDRPSPYAPASGKSSEVSKARKENRL